MARKPVNQWRSWDDAPHVLCTSEMLELFRLDRRTLGDMVNAGLIERGRAGRNYRYARAEVMRFANDQHIDPFPASNPFHVEQSRASKAI